MSALNVVSLDFIRALPPWIKVEIDPRHSPSPSMTLFERQHALYVTFPLDTSAESNAKIAQEALAAGVFDKEYPDQDLALMRRKWEALAAGVPVSDEDTKMQARHDYLMGD